LNIPNHDKYPFDGLDQNNLTHGVYWIPQKGIAFLVGFGRVMQYLSKVSKDILWNPMCF
jgi:hypothetical protein